MLVQTFAQTEKKKGGGCANVCTNHSMALFFCQAAGLLCHLQLKSGLFAIESWTRFQLKAGLL